VVRDYLRQEGTPKPILDKLSGAARCCAGQWKACASAFLDLGCDIPDKANGDRRQLALWSRSEIAPLGAIIKAANKAE